MADWQLDGSLPVDFEASGVILSMSSTDDLPPCPGSFVSRKPNDSTLAPLKYTDGCGYSASVGTVSKCESSVDVHSRCDPSNFNPNADAVGYRPQFPKPNEEQVKQAASGSSREESDDELETYTATYDIQDPSLMKRARRMLSNRESARRSRKRKQDQLNELESQIGQLKDENTSLRSQYSDINRRCRDASANKRILQAEIETLRTKVKIAEQQVKQATSLNPAMLPIPSFGYRLVGPSSYVSSLPQNSDNSFTTFTHISDEACLEDVHHLPNYSYDNNGSHDRI